MDNDAAAAIPGLKRLFPFQSRFFPIKGGYKLHYIDEGTGPVLLMMHACPMWIFSFRELIRKFSLTHRVIAIDQMGFGLSDKPVDFDYSLENHTDILDNFIRKMELHDITFIAHGRGSTIAFSYAVRYPDNIRAMITMNAMAFSNFPLPVRLQVCRFRWFGAKIILNMNLFAKETRKMSRNVRCCYLRPMQGPEGRNALLSFIENIPCVPEDDSAQSMLEVESSLWMLREKPVCIIWAGKDWLYKKSSFKRWIKYFPEAEVYQLPKAGRYLPEDEPKELAKIIDDFLRNHKC